MSKFFSNIFNFTSTYKNKCLIWDNISQSFNFISDIKTIPLDLLCGINNQKKSLIDNTIKFAEGYMSNNALLWGVRGNGKSTLIKSTFKNQSKKYINLRLVQINKKDIQDLIKIYEILEKINLNFILFIDDLSFENDDPEYKLIKSILDGNIKEQPNNIIIYVTSNRRHLMETSMRDNEDSDAIYTHENIEEKISLSDRFGLWLGFHNLSQVEYINIINSYSKYFSLDISEKELSDSLKWSLSRGNRNGRTAWQFIVNLAATKKIKIDF